MMNKKQSARIGRKLIETRKELVAKALASNFKHPDNKPAIGVDFGKKTDKTVVTVLPPPTKEQVNKGLNIIWTNFGQRGRAADDIRIQADAKELTEKIIQNKQKIQKLHGDGQGDVAGWVGEEGPVWDNDADSDSPNRTLTTQDEGSGKTDAKEITGDESETDVYGTDPGHTGVSDDSTVRSAVSGVFDDADLLLALRRAIEERKAVKEEEGGPGSGRYPKGSGQSSQTHAKISERVSNIQGYLRDKLGRDPSYKETMEVYNGLYPEKPTNKQKK